jgi:hypothetical protein
LEVLPVYEKLTAYFEKEVRQIIVELQADYGKRHFSVNTLLNSGQIVLKYIKTESSGPRLSLEEQHAAVDEHNFRHNTELSDYHDVLCAIYLSTCEKLHHDIVDQVSPMPALPSYVQSLDGLSKPGRTFLIQLEHRMLDEFMENHGEFEDSGKLYNQEECDNLWHWYMCD